MEAGLYCSKTPSGKRSAICSLTKSRRGLSNTFKTLRQAWSKVKSSPLIPILSCYYAP